MTPGDRLRDLSLALGLGPSPERTLTALEGFYAEVDAELGAGSEGLELPCRAGCDACCREAVFLSAPEFLLVARELLTQPTLLAEVTARMLQAAERFADELELLETLEPGAERDEVSARVKFDCPLLDHSGRCRVHRARELNARSFGQSWDENGDAPFGCGLTHARLVTLGSGGAPARRTLPGARALRRKLRDRVPGVGSVHVYPWWFAHYARWL